jgi:hypothetical protein
MDATDLLLDALDSLIAARHGMEAAAQILTRATANYAAETDAFKAAMLRVDKARQSLTDTAPRERRSPNSRAHAPWPQKTS